MPHRYPVLIVLSVLVMLSCVYTIFVSINASGLPFGVTLVDAHTAVVEKINGIPLPSGLQAGDQIDLQATPREGRIALIPYLSAEARLAAGSTVPFAVRKGGTVVAVPVASVDIRTAYGRHSLAGIGVLLPVLLAVIALLLLWRGRDRVSASMTLWAVAVLVGNAFVAAPASPSALLEIQFAASACFLLARIGFYFTIECMLGAALSRKRRAMFRGFFLLVLLLGAMQQLGGTYLLVAAGWAEFLRLAYGLIFSASYLVPVIMLFLSYGVADSEHRLRLRWILWSSVIWLVGIVLSNSSISLLGFVNLNVILGFAYVIALFGFLYAVLRHRVVDVSFVVSRTLVYTATMSVIIGLFAAMNSLVEHAALGQGANLLLELLVPLLLGIGFNSLRTRIDGYVSRLFFRRRYRAEQALNDFAHSCAFIDKLDRLLDLTAKEVFRHSGAQGVALYDLRNRIYTRVRHLGSQVFPSQVEADDLAFVNLRAGQRDVDLHECNSVLAQDGYVFPLSVRGELIGALVCGPRPGEAYTSDECQLLAHVAHQAGIALHVLRMQSKAVLVDALASGALEPAVAHEQALKLSAGWAGS